MRIVILLATLAAAVPAAAALAPGAKAPDFDTRGGLKGHEFRVQLSHQLKRGPMVLYFFPAAGTKGCNAEAKAFADAIPQFKAAGARVLGLSTDTVETLKTFSAKECAGMFPVASAGPKVVAGYDVDFGQAVSIKGAAPRQITTRTSYVVAPDGTILYEHTGNDPLPHVTGTLKAVEDWRAAHR